MTPQPWSRFCTEKSEFEHARQCPHFLFCEHCGRANPHPENIITIDDDETSILPATSTSQSRARHSTPPHRPSNGIDVVASQQHRQSAIIGLRAKKIKLERPNIGSIQHSQRRNECSRDNVKMEQKDRMTVELKEYTFIVSFLLQDEDKKYYPPPSKAGIQAKLRPSDSIIDTDDLINHWLPDHQSLRDLYAIYGSPLLAATLLRKGIPVCIEDNPFKDGILGFIGQLDRQKSTNPSKQIYTLYMFWPRLIEEATDTEDEADETGDENSIFGYQRKRKRVSSDTKEPSPTEGLSHVEEEPRIKTELPAPKTTSRTKKKGKKRAPFWRPESPQVSSVGNPFADDTLQDHLPMIRDESLSSLNPIDGNTHAPILEPTREISANSERAESSKDQVSPSIHENNQQPAVEGPGTKDIQQQNGTVDDNLDAPAARTRRRHGIIVPKKT